ncbi:MAG: response regulator [Gemmatimonadales bacterium]
MLIVDNEPLMHGIANRVLGKADLELLNALDGVAAIELLGRQTRAPALVVTDMQMPRMGGAELGRWLATTYPGVPVLYVSGFAPDRERPPIPDSQLTRHWLAKPLAPEQLLQRVTDLCRRPDSPLD